MSCAKRRVLIIGYGVNIRLALKKASEWRKKTRKVAVMQGLPLPALERPRPAPHGIPDTFAPSSRPLSDLRARAEHLNHREPWPIERRDVSKHNPRIDTKYLGRAILAIPYFLLSVDYRQKIYPSKIVDFNKAKIFYR